MKKKVRTMALTILSIAMMATAGCTKIDDPNNGGNNGGNGNGGGNGGGSIENHEYVDFGLPSGNLWATCNIGAETPQNDGLAFCWGETIPRYSFDNEFGESEFYDDYKFFNEGRSLTKYCQLPDYGTQGYSDLLTILQPEDDAATANWGNDWCIPTREDWEELYRNVHHERIELGYGNEGLLFTGSNGQTLYLMGRLYMTSSLYPVRPQNAFSIESYQGTINHPLDNWERNCTFRVRPVRKTGNNQNTVNEGGVGVVSNHEYVDLGLPSGILWATSNIGASIPEEYGDYFAWAETTPKEHYSWDNYKYAQEDSEGYYHVTKYYDYDEPDFIDSFESMDDAAVINWGGGWHTPSLEDWEELLRCCYHGQATLNNVKGCYFIGKNGQTLFLPNAGYYSGGTLFGATNDGLYWSNSLNSNNTRDALTFYTNREDEMGMEGQSIDFLSRYRGGSVRPVFSGK